MFYLHHQRSRYPGRVGSFTPPGVAQNFQPTSVFQSKLNLQKLHRTVRARNAESLRTRSSTGASPSAPLRCASAFQISITRPVKADNGLRNNGLRIVLVFLHDQVRAAICFGAVFSLICEYRRLRGVVSPNDVFHTNPRALNAQACHRPNRC